MPIKKSKLEKISEIIKKYPSEFSLTALKQLHCDICHKLVNFEKKFFIESHRFSLKHQSKTITKLPIHYMAKNNPPKNIKKNNS